MTPTHLISTCLKLKLMFWLQKMFKEKIALYSLRKTYDKRLANEKNETSIQNKGLGLLHEPELACKFNSLK